MFTVGSCVSIGSRVGLCSLWGVVYLLPVGWVYVHFGVLSIYCWSGGTIFALESCVSTAFGWVYVRIGVLCIY